MASNPRSSPQTEHPFIYRHCPIIFSLLNWLLPRLPLLFRSSSQRSRRSRSRERPMSKQTAKSTELPVLPPVPDTSRDEPVKQGGTQPAGAAPDPGSQWHAHGFPAVSRHRFLTSAEWTTIATGIGGVGDLEGHKPVHPTSWWWPPRGLPRGLYRDIVTRRTNIVRWALMVGQLLIGAAITSLGSMSMSSGMPITVLGAMNTIIAGMLALLHNSGLPDRYRYDMAQFEELEDRVKEILDSGIAPIDMTTDQVLAECFDLFRMAKATVTANMPVNYNSRQALQSGTGSAEPRPDPTATRPSMATASADSPVVGGGDKKKDG
ncbi:hypothetical protein L249_3788 [Ophiocordyceps polyrhachis-furcata BCC 54312]|uniref:SMODS and SLOG-associating 2TM effector domain-containing protein n=1 Tax=Ophiocordyceps polyrhachis-furcata BCC 54312 TaxID=1330021 RepID=A0A367L5K1_9HYPO|nr:hypothetical protein L249_3788 [Ophiocordyceps polyrhachis-furcata BCC 54312]